MVKITLDIADNGAIKTIIDDNANGAGGRLETKKVYDFEKSNHKRQIQFFYELADDLGIDTGNKFEKDNIIMKVDWGSSYMPTKREVLKKIKSLEFEIETLKMFLEEDSEENIDDNE